jgi:bifunctional non-homologous end joining protein LigD
MDLTEYRGKRDSARTTEPIGEDPEPPRGPTHEGAFVVHLHDARRRHWDLRIQAGGVLASFAVPRGPTLDPTARRLAIRTEDHPLEYLEFGRNPPRQLRRGTDDNLGSRAGAVSRALG